MKPKPVLPCAPQRGSVVSTPKSQNQESSCPIHLQAAEECVRRKWPGRNWQNKAEYRSAVLCFYSLMQDAEFRRRFPNRRYGVIEAEQRAKDGSLWDLWAVLSTQAPAFLADSGSWLWQRFQKAFVMGNRKFVNTVMYGFWAYWKNLDSERIPEGRWEFLLWFLVNNDTLKTLTAEEILERWEEKRRELFKQGVRDLPTFRGDNRELKFRQWLSRQGFKLGQRGKKHQPSVTTIARRKQGKHVT